MRKCFIHIGTHKTGTTSLQQMLSERRDELAALGFIYPTSGVPGASHGHHNIAWELSGDRRFDPGAGAMAGLFGEIAGGERDIILSSEDFTGSVGEANALGDWVARLRAEARCAVTFVVYLRAQSDYIRSLYLELLRHGLDAEFRKFLAGVIDDGVLRWREWKFFFDYRALLEALPRGVEIVARGYTPATSVIDDFLPVIGLTSGQLAVSRDYRLNPGRSPREALAIYYFNRTGARLPEQDSAAVMALDEALGAGRLDMTRAGRARTIAAFEASNAWVKERYGVEGLEREAPDSSAGLDEAPSLESAFSEATIRKIEASVGGARAPVP